MMLYMSVGMGTNVEAVRRHCMENMVPVSYTHLTLPTIYSV